MIQFCGLPVAAELASSQAKSACRKNSDGSHRHFAQIETRQIFAAKTAEIRVAHTEVKKNAPGRCEPKRFDIKCHSLWATCLEELQVRKSLGGVNIADDQTGSSGKDAQSRKNLN